MKKRFATNSERTEADYVAEARYWRDVATYLADCHAATAYDYEAKPISKSRRDRIIAILTTCVAALNKHPSNCGNMPRSEQEVADRCMKTITRLHAVNGATK